MLYWMAAEIGPGLLLVGAVFGCMWSPFAVAVNRLLRPPVSWPRALAALAVVPATWLVPEWIRSYQGLGGPWGVYGASQWQHPAVLAPRQRRGSVAGQRRPADRQHRAHAAPRRAVRPALPAPALPKRPPGALAASRSAAAGVVAFVIAAGSGPLAASAPQPPRPFPSVRQSTIALVQPGCGERPRPASVDACREPDPGSSAAEGRLQQDHAPWI